MNRITAAIKTIDLKQKPNPRETIGLAIVFVLITFVMVRSCVLPNSGEISQLQSTLETTATQIKAAQLLGDALKQASKQKQAVKKEAVVGVHGSLNNTMRDLSQPFLDREILINQIEVSDIKTEGAFVTRDIKLTVLGNYKTMGKYIEHLENMPAPLVIKSIEITSSNPDSITAEFSGSVYAVP
jgi:Tfp pilus assembly protein PilO